MLNLLGDIFLRSQNVTDKEFIGKLEQRGIEYTVRRIETATCIEVGRLCYRFNGEGQSRGVEDFSRQSTYCGDRCRLTSTVTKVAIALTASLFLLTISKCPVLMSPPLCGLGLNEYR